MQTDLSQLARREKGPTRLIWSDRSIAVTKNHGCILLGPEKNDIKSLGSNCFYNGTIYE